MLIKEMESDNYHCSFIDSCCMGSKCMQWEPYLTTDYTQSTSGPILNVMPIPKETGLGKCKRTNYV